VNIVLKQSPLRQTRLLLMLKMQEWDKTNFLVNLAGHYANCDRLRSSGVIQVDRRTPQGEMISGFVDNVDGTGTDVDSVNGYIRSLVSRWTSGRTYNLMVSHNITRNSSVDDICWTGKR